MPASESDTLIHPATGAGLIFNAAACGPQPAPDLLEPAAYAPTDRQRVGARGGRGSAWFVQSVCGPAVLRHYRRGGLFGRVIREHYLWLGAEATRCVREYRLLRRLHELGLPVPNPLAAGWWRQGLVYRQALLTARIPDTQSLAERLAASATLAPWEAAGQTIAQFHRHGLRHADLNAHNVLCGADGRIWLIDFDRCRLGPPSRPWAEDNLRRLRRSLVKLGGVDGETGWQRLYDAWRIELVRR